MKKNIYSRYAAIMCMGTLAMALTACGSSAETATEQTVVSTEAATAQTEVTTQETTEAASTEDAAEEPTTIEPEESQLTYDGSMDDVQISVSFTPDDISKDGDTYSLTYTAYDLVTFDAYYIDNLKVGDTIVMSDGPVVVESITNNNTGLIMINGGLEEGGYDLTDDGNLGYYESGMDIYGNYAELGQATLPISADCVIKDSSADPDTAVDLTVEELLTNELPFNQYNTTIVVSGGEITEITRSFTP